MEKEILVGNKLIAEFMNLKLTSQHGDTWWSAQTNGRADITNEELAVTNASYYDSCYSQREDGAELKFHKAWNWLMPVIQKIENGLKWKYSCKIENSFYAHGIEYVCTIHDAGDETCIELVAQSKIKVTYQAVVEFIKWYNKNKKA